MVKRHALLLTIAASASLAIGADKKIDVPVFLFSGQSNMVCLGAAVSALSTEDKNMSFENIKIHNRSDNAKSGWSTLKPGFGADAQHFGFELFFGKVLATAMPDVKMAFIKDASSGTYLGQSGGWLPPSSGGPGTLYKNMMTHIDNALNEFNTAFDTSKYQPRWAGFIWHQGEFDAWNDKGLADKYEENLTNLIKDIREKAGDDSMPAIIPMINQSTMSGMSWQYIDIVNAAEIAVAKKTVNCDTAHITSYKLTDGIHYDAASMEDLSSRVGDRWLAMDFCKDWWNQTAVHRTIPVVSQAAFMPVTGSTFFDLSGRKINVDASVMNQNALPLIMIRSAVTSTGERKISKTLNLK